MITIRCYTLFAFCILVAFCSCNNSKTLLLKNNAGSYDSLPVKIRVNGKTEIDRYEQRKDVNLDYSEKEVQADGDTLCVEVSLPSLGINKTSCAPSKEANIMVVTIHEAFSQFLFDSITKANPTNQDKRLYRIPQVSIAFLKEKLNKVH